MSLGKIDPLQHIHFIKMAKRLFFQSKVSERFELLSVASTLAISMVTTITVMTKSK